MRCAGHDHFRSEYTDEQRAHLDLVAAFNRELATAGEAGRDLTRVTQALDPDPLRYMWVDEGDRRIPALLSEARQLLAESADLRGHTRLHGRPAPGGAFAARPSVAVGSNGSILLAWIEWQEDVGEQVVVTLLDEAGEPVMPATAVSGAPADCFRPTALFDAEAHPWVFFARANGGQVLSSCSEAVGHVAVWARRWDGGRWSDEELVSTTAHPSFNQEVVAHADGGVEVCWQGRLGSRFAGFARRWDHGRWQDTQLISDDGSGDNVWDPSLAALPGGGSAYAWSAYTDGAYRVMTRRRDAEPSSSSATVGRLTLGPCRPLSSGTDYALHPSLAVTGDGQVWCAFDAVTVHGHAGSGPTALRRLDRLGDTGEPGMKPPGEFVPPELIPNLAASVHVVAVDDQGVRRGRGCLAGGLEISPAGLPRLAATPDGGLVVAYRTLRRLPLLNYYWEVAAQVLGKDGWGPVITFDGSDAGVEEATAAAGPDGAVVAWQSDGRRERAFEWTEGFGGRACPHLHDHYGEVVWHGMHGPGQIRFAPVASNGPAGTTGPQPIPRLSARREARAWTGGDRQRYRTQIDGEAHSLYWGDLHRHSLISRCTAADEPSLDEFYRYSWDVCEYDFWAVTDHSENSTAYQWWCIQKIADLFKVDGRFVPLYGFEWTSTSGHQNVIYSSAQRGGPIFSSLAEGSQRPDQLWQQLRRFPDYPAITIPHHPGSGMVPYDWNHYDADYLRLVEIFQACRGNYEDDGCFRQYADATLPGSFVLDGLRRGYRFGLIASSDHGNGASYVGAYATDLDRATIFDALRSRRTMGATARDIVLDTRIGDTFMGGERRQTGPVEMDVYARGYRELARVDLLRNGELVHSRLPELDLPRGWIAVPLRLEWGMNPSPTDSSGTLRVEGGEVLRTSYWSPEVVEVSQAAVRWTAATQSFGGGGIYGPTRGGIELTVVGPPDAVVRVDSGAGKLFADLATLRAHPVDATSTTMSTRAQSNGRLRLQPGVGGLSGLGATELRLRWTDERSEPAWYYARAYLVDGEMAWSSPIWVDTDEAVPAHAGRHATEDRFAP
ncbi:MAG: DUF3604 domain-containing protein [Actinomycetota bacterium]|nr:DUF3604 domain-containing protein [Actinomycetota bacterium]